MSRFEDRVIFSATLVEPNHEHAFDKDFNELSWGSGFSLMNAERVVVRKSEKPGPLGESLGIFVYRNNELIGKNFVFEFEKGYKRLEFYRRYQDGKPTYAYGFKLIET